MNNELIIPGANTIEDINTQLRILTAHHKAVSQHETPRAYKKKKMGMDYVEYSYMRDLADKYYPGWSWEIIKSEALSDMYYIVHGRLKWYDNGVHRTGDAIAAHRIQKQSNGKNYVDIGNDVKAANTDTIKKAFNMYMNIADDIYKNQIEDVELSEQQQITILNIAAKISQEMKETIQDKLNNDEINGLNYKGSLVKLERMAKK